MTYSSLDDVLSGHTLPLTPAPCTLAVWQPVLCPALLVLTHPDSPLHGYHEARGYRFAWGHVLEGVLPPDEEDPDSLLMWDFVLEDAQEQYQALGGTLEELADMALVFLDTSMPRPAPRWLRYDDGVQPAAFAFEVPATHGPAARRWLRTFLTHGLPRPRAGGVPPRGAPQPTGDGS